MGLKKSFKKAVKSVKKVAKKVGKVVKTAARQIEKTARRIEDQVENLVKSDIFKIFIKTLAAVVGAVVCAPLGLSTVCAAAAYAAVGALYGETSLEEIGMNLIMGAMIGYSTGPGLGGDLGWAVTAEVAAVGVSNNLVLTGVYLATVAAVATGVQVVIGEAAKEVYKFLPESWGEEARIAVTAVAIVFTQRYVSGSYQGGSYQSGASTTATKTAVAATETDWTILSDAKHVIDTTSAYQALSAISSATMIAVTEMARETTEELERLAQEMDSLRRQIDEFFAGLEDAVFIAGTAAAKNFSSLAGGFVYNNKAAGGRLYQFSDAYHPGQLLFGEASNANEQLELSINLPFGNAYAGTSNYSNGITV